MMILSTLYRSICLEELVTVSNFGSGCVETNVTFNNFHPYHEGVVSDATLTSVLFNTDVRGVSLESLLSSCAVL